MLWGMKNLGAIDFHINPYSYNTHRFITYEHSGYTTYWWQYHVSLGFVQMYQKVQVYQELQ